MDLATGLAAHRQALTGFQAAAAKVPEARWNDPSARDKWSPGQVAEHLRLTYAMVGGELDGKVGLAVRSPWWMRPILRFSFLRKILATGAVPPGAKAPRELRPGVGPYPRTQTLAALGVAAAEFEAALARRWDDSSARATHHVFGTLTPAQILRFSTVHLDHHARQLPRSNA